MSKGMFIECSSPDPVVRALARRAIRILNDDSLDRDQRVRLITRIKFELQAHQSKPIQLNHSTKGGQHGRKK